jgi:hypothetical protein
MPFRYVLFNKPFRVLSQFTAESPNHQTLADFIPISGIYPVGRLDYDSEGLLLLTDDGKLQHRLSDPRFAHPPDVLGASRRPGDSRSNGTALRRLAASRLSDKTMPPAGATRAKNLGSQSAHSLSQGNPDFVD